MKIVYQDEDITQYELDTEECYKVSEAIFTDPDYHRFIPGQTYASVYKDCVNIDDAEGTWSINIDDVKSILNI